jgi:hypothetical protein
MASKKSAATSARSSPGNAGKATAETVARSRSAPKAPSKEDLDLRDMLKSGPRRPAGPPLVGDIMTKSAMDALRNQKLPAPTEPSKPKARK